MKIGINWEALPIASVDENIHMLKSYGFESTFIFSDHPGVHEILPKLAEEGLDCESCHAPFKGINSMWAKDESGEAMLAQLMQGVTVCAQHGVPTIVVHLSSGDNPPRVNETGLERYESLVNFAREKGVQITFENQRKLGNLALAMELFPDAGFCWDVGHEKALSEDIDFMSLFGKRIVALHLHDNRAFHNADDHLFPYEGKIDMEAAAKKLAASGYEKAVMLEVAGNQSSVYQHLTAEQYLTRASEAAKRFAERVVFWKQQKN